jgi:photosystem II stability/assembly factor-like uncharacterized protein
METRLDRLRVWAGLVTSLAIAANALALPSNYEDPLEQPAQMSDLQLRAPVLAITGAGTALIAVGQRGRILRATSPTSPWRQMAVPVSTDLVAVSFPSPNHGWAVGHDGIVLSSSDGGVSWQRRLDGRRAYQIELSYYKALAARGNAGGLREVRYLKKVASRAPAWPFLDVWFKNDSDGYLVGAFGMIFHTSDGGTSWTPMTDCADNPKRLHFYAVRGDADDTYIAGEQGTSLKFDSGKGRFVAMNAPYKGSFFGVAAQGARVVVYGLNGHAFLSDDRGSTWHALDTGTTQSIVGYAATPHGDLLFATQGGKIMRLQAKGTSISMAGIETAEEVFGIASTGDGNAVIATSTGPRSIQLSGGS